MKWLWLILGMLIGAGLMHIVFYYGLGPKGRKAVESVCNDDEAVEEKTYLPQSLLRNHLELDRKHIEVDGYVDLKYEPEKPAMNLHGSHSWQHIGNLLHSGLYKGEPLFGVSSGKEERPIDPFLRTFLIEHNVVEGADWWSVSVKGSGLIVDITINEDKTHVRFSDVRLDKRAAKYVDDQKNMYREDFDALHDAVLEATGIDLEIWSSAWVLYHLRDRAFYHANWDILVNGISYQCTLMFSVPKVS